MDLLTVMSNRFALLLFSVAMGVATAAAAQDSAPLAQNTPAKDSQKRICKNERAIGSQMVKRVCRTQAEMDAQREAARRGMETNDNRCMQGASCKGG